MHYPETAYLHPDSKKLIPKSTGLRLHHADDDQKEGIFLIERKSRNSNSLSTKSDFLDGNPSILSYSSNDLTAKEGCIVNFP